MKRAIKILASSVIGLFIVAFAAVAWAYFSSSGTGTATASVATLNAPTNVAVTQPVAGTIHVAWTLPAQVSDVTLTSVSVRRSNGSSTTMVCGSPLAGTATSCDDSSAPAGSYTYTVTSVFRSWSAPSAPSSSITVASDTTPPSTPGLTVSALNNAFFDASAGRVFVRSGAASGSFTLTASSADFESGVSGYTFPAFDSSWTRTGSGASRTYTWSLANPIVPSGSQTVTAQNGVGLTANASFTVQADNTGPGVSPPTVTAGYSTTLSVPVVPSSAVDSDSGVNASSVAIERDEIALSNGSCGSFTGTWVAVTLTGNADTTVETAKCYRYRAAVSDNVGNQTQTNASSTAMVDTTSPSVPVLGFSSFANAVFSSSTATVYVRSDQPSGSFTVTPSSSDVQSGLAGYNYPAGFGQAAGSSTLARTYSWSSANPTLPAGPQAVSATNNAGLTSSGSNVSNPYTVVSDIAGPTVSVPTVSAGYFTSPSVPVTLGTPTDSGSGVNVASIAVQRDATAMTNGVCGTFASSWSAVTLTAGNDTTVVSGNCYRYRELVSDNLANQTTTLPSAVAKVDTTAPSAPTLAFSSMTNVGVSGATVFVRSAQATGAFTVTASSTDPESGVAGYTFPAFGTGWSVSGTGAARTYSWSAANPTQPVGSQSVTAQNGAGISSSGSASTNPFTVVYDNSAPTGAAVATTNAATIAGRPQVTDSVTLTFSELMKPSTIYSGWSSTSQPDVTTATATFRDAPTGNGTNSNDDSLSFAGPAGSTLNLGSLVGMDGNLVTARGGSFTYAATIRYSVVNGKSEVTVTLTALASGTAGTAAGGTATWSPDAASTDIAGNPVNTAATRPVTSGLPF